MEWIPEQRSEATDTKPKTCNSKPSSSPCWSTGFLYQNRLTSPVLPSPVILPFLFLLLQCSAAISKLLIMQRFVDNVLAVSKESVKTVTYESLSNIARFINWVSGLMLTFLPGKANILEGVHGWELRPSFQGPKLPRWMENGVSSFNQFIHELSVDSDTSSVDYSSGEDLDGSLPPTPTSQCSQSFRANSHSKPDWHQTHCLAYIFSWIILPIKLLLGIPCCLWGTIFHMAMGSRTPPVQESPRPSQSPPFRRRYSLKDHFVHRATDRRRGIIEDLHVGIEIIIEAIFGIFHKVAHFIFSPSEAFEVLCSWFSSPVTTVGDGHDDNDSDAPLTTQTLGDDVPAPQERNVSFYHPLNTDARTCQDVITELGYPYEAIRVITSDGYVLLLERIPRRDARKAVYLQHGILDSSMGWVSNGIVGSPAFAAFNQGYDVFLGNLRGLVSREHVDKNISSREYWRYSINEHGTEDIPAMIEKIHEIKTAELGLNHPDEEINDEQQPYKLSAICHSLGGAAMLMHVVTRHIEKKPHRLSRLVLLSPAGFHDDSNPVFLMAEYLFLLLAPVTSLLVPAFYIPTRFFRMLLNKLARDFHNYPAVGGLVQTLMSYVVGGDSSNWVGVLGLPHYNMDDMPGVSFRVAHHLAQIKHASRFRMYDYGSASANMRIYGSEEPLDIGENYGLIDIPVDLVAGSKDKVIRPSMVRKHYRLMKDAGVEVCYNEFEYAHLDFTFSHHEELLAYVMSRLLMEGAAPKQPERQPTVRSRKKVQPDS